ncbi:MAG: SDR family NAD(P)-dependent oxidoreductase [Alkalilacustris sp.]
MQGRRAIVTGGGSGIGRAIALRLAREGCALGVIDRDAPAAEAVADEIRAAGGTAAAEAADVADAAGVGVAIDTLVGRLGGIDTLVNNAGVLTLGTVLETDPAAWRGTFGVNVEGMVLCARAVLPRLIAQRSGRIVNLSSWMGKRGVPNYGAYCASKAAAISLTETLAFEVAAHGITVNAVCPGLIVDTRMRADSDAERVARGMPASADRVDSIPLGRVGLPEDVARLVAFLASDEAGFITGEAINVTGGMWTN